MTPRQRMRLEEAQLQRLDRFKRQAAPPCGRLGEEMISFFRRSVQKRQTRFARLAEAIGGLVPEVLLQHCCLEGFSRGTLTILVDSSAHLYELKQLLLAGLQQQILLACAGTGLRKIVLKPGRWYAGEDPARPRFDR
mgnify:CR=1 FL=1